MSEPKRVGPWYHGSPEKLTYLRQGSMVSPYIEVAKAFSHKPSILTFDNDPSAVSHNGQVPGRLYCLADEPDEGDLAVLSGTADTHWEVQRDLPVRFLCEVPIDDPPQLQGEALEKAQRFFDEQGGQTAFYSSETVD